MQVHTHIARPLKIPHPPTTCRTRATSRDGSKEGEAGGQKAKATQGESQEYSPIGMTIPRTATVMLLPMR